MFNRKNDVSFSGVMSKDEYTRLSYSNLKWGAALAIVFWAIIYSLYKLNGVELIFLLGFMTSTTGNLWGALAQLAFQSDYSVLNLSAILISGIIPFLVTALLMYLSLSQLSITVRRLRDCNYSVFFAFLPIILYVQYKILFSEFAKDIIYDMDLTFAQSGYVWSYILGNVGSIVLFQIIAITLLFKEGKMQLTGTQSI